MRRRLDLRKLTRCGHPEGSRPTATDIALLAEEMRADLSDPTIAVVVTYHSPDHLSDCVRSIQRQGHAVALTIVIDNDETASRGIEVSELSGEDVGESNFVVIRRGENLGPAGGFALGMELAQAVGARYVWALDDDVTPRDNCLSEQFEVMNRLGRRAVLLPAMEDRATRQRRDTWGWCGVLVSDDVLNEIGVPDPRLFWGYEDLEWIIDRTAAAGIARARVETALATVSMRPPDARLADWKLYYYCRNAMFMAVWGRRHLPALRRWKRQVVHLWGIMSRVSRSKNRGRAAGFVAHGLFDGAAGRLGRRVDPNEADRPS